MEEEKGGKVGREKGVKGGREGTNDPVERAFRLLSISAQGIIKIRIKIIVLKIYSITG